MTRRFEKGSVVGFVLVGVLLTALLIGGVWLAQLPADTAGEVATDTDTSQTEGTESEDDSTPTTDEELKETLNEQATQDADDDNVSRESASSNLPTSGPEDWVAQLVGASLLAASVVAYVRSRSVA